MHFMDNTEERLDRHQEINAAMKRAILQDLQQLLHEHHALVRLFEYFGAHAKCTERNAANMGRLTILLAMYIGSPHHMHEYTQDIMTYVRHYGLQHAHILIWLVERIQPDQIDDIICAEISDHEADPDLHDVTNMMTCVAPSIPNHHPNNFHGY
ncbi:hypothetical protein EVAR_56688_1 [Eumeta japonica]|uniref:Helitron helicase-like domain-containing protein n=1 Tax=Eumeta variegata TaxID=151549 RepID=A0A4C2A3X7_EUMVA|nr:hypothetical protein EVAR_56688_1 [Eumeta japonica]